jgi:hypothetical protein
MRHPEAHGRLAPKAWTVACTVRRASQAGRRPLGVLDRCARDAGLPPRPKAGMAVSGAVGVIGSA